MTGNGIDYPLVYAKLLAAYGPQGWWPLDHRRDTPGFDAQGYHTDLLVFDFGTRDVWCVFLGTVLTQRSTWMNARRAVLALIEGPCPVPGTLALMDEQKLAELIKPSGFFRQKALRLKTLEKKLMELRFFEPSLQGPSRNDLLDLPGLGPESADALWCYARQEEGFTADAYTCRLFSRLEGLTPVPRAGEDIQAPVLKYDLCRDRVLSAWNCRHDNSRLARPVPVCHAGLGVESSAHMLREFHALIVEHGKRYCRPRPLCGDCPLKSSCGGYRLGPGPDRSS